MHIYIALTDQTWFQNLRYSKPDEVNFWQPGGQSVFRALQPGELFLFKLHHPYNYIVGGGYFAYSNIIPLSLAWDSFQERNGAATLMEMKNLIEQHRKVKSVEDYNIGCIILTQPFFLPEDKWFDQPADWKKNIVQGKTYDVSTAIGQKIWTDIQLRIQAKEITADPRDERQQERYGTPVLVKPRLGQGGFRVIVTDAYRRRCAVTNERVLPALEAAHIKPYAESGPHEIGNGILLRSDLHKLLDKGYVTISPDYHFEVSRKIKEDFDNGEEYNKLHGAMLHLPSNPEQHPDLRFIKWHNERFKK